MSQTVTPADPPATLGFELERFGWAGDERLEVTGRWFGVRGRRFVRPTLTLRAGGRRRRLIALLDHKPWAAADEEAWTAAFAWRGAPEEVTTARLEVAPDVVLELPPPGDDPPAALIHPAPRPRPARRPAPGPPPDVVEEGDATPSPPAHEPSAPVADTEPAPTPPAPEPARDEEAEARAERAIAAARAQADAEIAAVRDRSRAELAALERRLVEAEQRAEERAEEVRRLRAELAAAQAVPERSRRELVEARRRAERAEQATAGLRQRVTDANELTARLERRLVAAADEAERLERRIAELEAARATPTAPPGHGVTPPPGMGARRSATPTQAPSAAQGGHAPDAHGLSPHSAPPPASAAPPPANHGAAMPDAQAAAPPTGAETAPGAPGEPSRRARPVVAPYFSTRVPAPEDVAEPAPVAPPLPGVRGRRPAGETGRSWAVRAVALLLAALLLAALAVVVLAVL